MRVPTALASYVVADVMPQEIPQMWSLAASNSPEWVRRQFADLLRLPTESYGRTELLRPGFVQILSPAAKRGAKHTKNWRLAIGLRNQHVLLFRPPSAATVSSVLPQALAEAVHEIGPWQCDLLGGRIIIDDEAARAADGLPEEARGGRRFLPFYDLLDGDYDCIDADDTDTMWHFNHERAEFQQCEVSGIASWFDMRMRELIGTSE